MVTTDCRNLFAERTYFMNPPAGWHPDPVDPNVDRYWDGQQWTDQTRPRGPVPSPQSVISPAPAKKRRKWPWIVGGVIALFVIVGLVGGNGSSETRTASNAASSPTSATKTQTPEEAEAERQAAEAAAEQQRQQREAAAAAARAEEEARQNPASYEVLGERDFAMIVKDPAAAKDRKVVLFGRVFQFDAATGTDQFLAYTSPVWEDSDYGYDQNTLVVASDPAVIANVVEDDIVKMYVEVQGSYSYDTQGGGNTTVPKVAIRIVEVVG
ncbi:DUF2510 domain-containing protein [Rhodococcus pyridinivorans]|uniref:DUF2510 domain-containing protein n=1 Tax=Rhodococcus pyridinivorans TaxID=103816 RepID=UPI001E4E7198|nr:DUF2510 domain-containing protein [Rhodococcus pyridinivorans]MCD5419776.1 DUF2510 domain-containing protein [Rhodococcus pyridinivorans]